MSGVCEGKLFMSLWYECQNLFLNATFACALLNGSIMLVLRSREEIVEKQSSPSPWVRQVRIFQKR